MYNIWNAQVAKLPPWELSMVSISYKLPLSNQGDLQLPGVQQFLYGYSVMVNNDVGNHYCLCRWLNQSNYYFTKVQNAQLSSTHLTAADPWLKNK